MTNWYQLAKELALVDKRIGGKLTEILQDFLLADGKIDKDEFKFLIALRREAEAVAPEFDQFVFKSIKKAILLDGEVSTERTDWLKRLLIADGVLDAGKIEFLRDLKKSTRNHCEEFVDWCRKLGI